MAIVLVGDNTLVGSVDLMHINKQHQRGVLGFWVGHEYWGCGYCTEAAREIICFGFGELGLNRISASCFARNAASRRVMQKIGMTCEGVFRQDMRKWDKFEDMERYSILASEWRVL